MKIFLLDDTPAKHEALPFGLTAVNEQMKARGLPGMHISAGFETAHEAIDALADAPKLWQLLHCPDALFLIDLKLIDQDPENPRFFNSAREFTKLIAPKEVSDEFDRLYTTTPPAERKNDTVLSLKLICAAKALKKPFIMVSTLGEYGTIQALTRCKLVDDNVILPETDDPAAFGDFAEHILQHLDPITSLRAKTEGWFSGHEAHHWQTGPTHGFFDGNPGGELGLQRLPALVRSVFPWFPETPFPDVAAASAFHQALKTFCGGGGAQWSGGRHRLSLGGAYLLLLYAMQTRHAESLYESPGKFLLDFRDLLDRQSVLRPFLPEQPPLFAEVTFRALFSLFLGIVTNEDSKSCAISSIGFERDSGAVRVVLTWSPAHTQRLAERAAETIGQGFHGLRDNGTFRFSTAQTSGAMLRFVLASQVRERGFGAPGRVIIEGNGLLRLCP